MVEVGNLGGYEILSSRPPPQVLLCLKRIGYPDGDGEGFLWALVAIILLCDCRYQFRASHKELLGVLRQALPSSNRAIILTFDNPTVLSMPQGLTAASHRCLWSKMADEGAIGRVDIRQFHGTSGDGVVDDIQELIKSCQS